MRLRQYLVLKGIIPSRVYIGLGWLSFAVLFAVWCVLTYGGFIPSLFLPSPTDIAVQFYRMLTELNLVGDILASVYRVSAGFLLASLIGVPLGLLMGSFKLAEGLIEPVVGFVRYMPASAFIPLLILWIGIGDLEKIAVIFIGTFFQQVLMVRDVAKNISHELIDTSYTLGANQRAAFLKVVLPASLPGIVDTLRITLGWAWTYLVVAELVGASSGLGYMIMEAQRFLRTAGIIVGILVIGLLGLLTDTLFKALYHRIFPWLEGRAQ
ncbi:MAG: ABC transporter permease [Firmicutes bacterium]|nr:ABC transporter permease [Bacillota bacterium]